MSNVLNTFKQAGSGNDNEFIVGGVIKTGAGQNLKKTYITVELADISSTLTAYVASPVAGTITNIQIIIDGPIIAADALITSGISAVNITGGSVNISNVGSAAGIVYSAAPTALNAVSVGSNINFTSDGASLNTVKATISIEITLS